MINTLKNLLSHNVVTNFDKSFLEKHIQEKAINNIWVYSVLSCKEDDLSKVFPYKRYSFELNTEKAISRVINLKKDEKITLIDGVRFLINIPMRGSPGYVKQKLMVNQLIEKISKEGFSTNAVSSQKIAKERLFIVFGVNQIKSIDERINKAFCESIKTCDISNSSMKYGVEGFYLTPYWFRNSNFSNLKEVKKLTDKESENFIFCDEKKAFSLIRYLDDIRSRFLQQKLEGSLEKRLFENINTKVPFTKIREYIKNSESTKLFFNNLYTKSLLYFMTMDDDIESLRVGEQGYFSYLHYVITNRFIEEKYYPSVISLGYFLNRHVNNISEKSVKIDMAVRYEMNRFLKNGCYFPEPGTGYFAKKKGFLEKFTFLSKKGTNFESRRAIENGIANGIIDQSKMVFKNWKTFFTQMPDNMKPKKLILEKYKDKLLPIDFFRSEVLKALRGIRQIHFNPLSWGKALYHSLPSNLKKGRGISGKIAGIFSRIFKFFDPIEQVIITGYDPNSLDVQEVMYDFPSAYMLFAQEVVNNRITRSYEDNFLFEYYGKERIFLNYNNLLAELKNLEKLGFDEAIIQHVLLAAFFSGMAIYNELYKN